MAGPAVLPREAIAFLRAKKLKPSRHWLSVWREEHASAFTVAQMTRQDLLRQTHRELHRVLRRGETVESFLERLQPWLEAKGWAPTGRGGDLPTRLRRIYHTNLRTAHLAGQWERTQRTKRLLPWLVYGLSHSVERREEHAGWVGTCLRVDDPWWRTHYPPNGWGCKCWVSQVAEPPAGATTKAPRVRTRPWTNPATGEILDVPEGIDPGWDYNVAAHPGLGAVQALTDRLQRQATPARPRTGSAARNRIADMVAADTDFARALAEREAAEIALYGPSAPAVGAPERFALHRRRVEAQEAVEAAETALRQRLRRDVVCASRLPRGAPALSFHGDVPDDMRAAANDWRRMVAPVLQRRIGGEVEVRRHRPTANSDLAGYAGGPWRPGSAADAPSRVFAENPETVVHELGHHVESWSSDLLQESRDWYRRRTRDFPSEERTLDGYSYRVVPDDFMREYTGRAPYRGGPTGVYATEVVSTGLEAMWKHPEKFAVADPDHFDFIWERVMRRR